MLLIYTIVAASIPLIAVAPSRGFLYAAALLFGIGLGALAVSLLPRPHDPR